MTDQTPLSTVSKEPRLYGVIDLLRSDRVAGWVIDRTDPSRTAMVDVLREGRVVGRVTADRPRKDLERQAVGTARWSWARTGRSWCCLGRRSTPPKLGETFRHVGDRPLVADLLEGGKRVAYGARAISEGGWQSIPKLTVPGAALLGCSAGMVNVPRIKGNHNAMLSGIAAAEAAAAAIAAGRMGDELTDYETEVRSGAIAKDLKPVRNVKPLWSRLGLSASLALGGFDMWVAGLTGWNPMGTWKHGKTDAQATGKAADFKPIDYPKPDGKLSFDRLTNVAFSFTNHEESQPCHLKLKDPSIPIAVNLPLYAEPAQRYCPAGVYEVLEGPEGPRFQINFQNCVHCKTCDIKDPSQNINWTTPQGGDGPNYPNM